MPKGLQMREALFPTSGQSTCLLAPTDVHGQVILKISSISSGQTNSQSPEILPDGMHLDWKGHVSLQGLVPSHSTWWSGSPSPSVSKLHSTPSP